MRLFAFWLAVGITFLSACSPGSECQTSVSQDQQSQPSEREQPSTTHATAHFGIGVSLSSLGLGMEAAILASERSNVRVGFNVLG
jgi:outer membrane biogenesis lipoprotein LolB